MNYKLQNNKYKITMKKIILSMAIASMSVAASAQLQSGIKLDNLNQSVKAGDDFYQFACGGWMKNNPLPAAYARFGSFDQLAQDNNVRINNILKDLLEKDFPTGTNEQKMSDYYKLAMDSVRRNHEGVKPVMPLIREIEAAKTKGALEKLMQKYAIRGYGRVYSGYFAADEKDSKNNKRRPSHAHGR
jgi:Predicted metalloendopeptidase